MLLRMATGGTKVEVLFKVGRAVQSPGLEVN